MKCPFMDKDLASIYSRKVSIAFGTNDKRRPSRLSNDWQLDKDAVTFKKTLSNALRNADDYVWHYTQWQDWWGMTTEEELRPFVAAIRDAKSEAKPSPKQ